jgi:hypothetical protein
MQIMVTVIFGIKPIQFLRVTQFEPFTLSFRVLAVKNGDIIDE